MSAEPDFASNIWNHISPDAIDFTSSKIVNFYLRVA